MKPISRRGFLALLGKAIAVGVFAPSVAVSALRPPRPIPPKPPDLVDVGWDRGGRDKPVLHPTSPHISSYRNSQVALILKDGTQITLLVTSLSLSRDVEIVDALKGYNEFLPIRHSETIGIDFHVDGESFARLWSPHSQIHETVILRANLLEMHLEYPCLIKSVELYEMAHDWSSGHVQLIALERGSIMETVG